MLQIKTLKLKSKALQSPMAGCTDLPFRLIARRHGLELCFTEMISAESLIRKSKETDELLRHTPEDRLLGVQLFGNRPESMAESAAQLETLGFDVVDLNLACPVPKITSKGNGAALLRQPQKAKKIFESVVKAVRKIPVTVKIRTGYEDASGSEAVRISKIAEDAGISMVTIHGRTRAQRYSGKPDWTIIAKVKNAVRIPVIGNGGIRCGEDAKRMRGETGCDAVMASRGALGNPWIYKEIDCALGGKPPPKQPGFDEKKRTLLDHFKLERLYFGEKMALLQMRRVACWYFDGIPGASQFRKMVTTSGSIVQMKKIIEEFEPLELQT